MQGILWSCSTEELDLEKDRAYIIHQTLAYGTHEQIRWLAQSYDRETLRDTFIHSPLKVYSKSALHFASLLLDIPYQSFPEASYDTTSPRNIG